MVRKTFIAPKQTFVDTLSKHLESIPASEIANVAQRDGIPFSEAPLMAWRSRYYVAQLYNAATAEYPLMLRLTISRTKLRKDGRWEDGLTWDELNAIKQELGYGDWYGVEVYPPTQDIQNLQNFRHLWINPESLGIEFKRRG